MTEESLHEIYMNRCLELANLGLGHTAPNPLVGAVVVYNHHIIGEGYHQLYGGPHAEVNAINSVKEKNLLEHATLYVNLEPCSHSGKTPPCTDLIINCGIRKVIAGIEDPNPLVSGKGLKKLRDAGIQVTAEVLPEACKELNRRFIMFHTHKRPYIILKWAETQDGFIDVVRGDPQIKEPTWISNEISRMLVHKWRSEEQSILVGTKTASMDNPHLNVREWPGKSPVRLVIDRMLKLPGTLNLFDNTSPTLVFNECKNEKVADTRYVRIDFTDNFIGNMMCYLYDAGIQSVLVEGGRVLIESFIQAKLWDEARVFKGKKVFRNGIPAPEIPMCIPEKYLIRKDLLLHYRNEHTISC